MMRTEVKPKVINKIINSEKNIRNELDQHFYGSGKLLITGEYFVLDGADAFALPTTIGQSLSVRYSPSFSPRLYWKSYDVTGKLWFETIFEFWHFDILSDAPTKEEVVLQTLLREARLQNTHFLRDGQDVHVETNIEFPLNWGLGSSSTLVHNIAAWAYISPFELLFKTSGGSGYDVACAQSDGPILYKKLKNRANWSPIKFSPKYLDQLYFIYRGKKQNTSGAIEYYNSKKPISPSIISEISKITNDLVAASELTVVEELLTRHETIIARELGMTPIKEELFSDYWGAIKSLGAWGGDFILATSDRGMKETEEYFVSRQHEVIIPYRELILGAKSRPLEIANEPVRLH